MSEKDKAGGISRRKLLGSIAAVGSLGAFTGAATEASMIDLESLPGNFFKAGDLDLRIGWWMLREKRENDKKHSKKDGDEVSLEVVDSHPNSLPDTPTANPSFEQLGDNQATTLTFDGLKPGDSGRLVLPFMACSNPSWIWLRVRPHGFRENGVTHDEEKAGDDGGSGELQDHLRTRVYYDEGCDGEFNEADTKITGGLGNGVLLDGSDDPEGGQDCEKLGKVEYEDKTGEFVVLGPDDGVITRFDVDEDDPSFTLNGVEITFTDLYFKDEDEHDKEEVIGFDFTSSEELCKAVVAGGSRRRGGHHDGDLWDLSWDHDDDDGKNDSDGGNPASLTETYPLGCATSGTGLFAPKEDFLHKEIQYGLSHVTFYRCTGDDRKECFECEPACVTLEWELPGKDGEDKEDKDDEDHSWWDLFTNHLKKDYWRRKHKKPWLDRNGSDEEKKDGDGGDVEEVQSDSMKIEIEFVAEQCRHNAEPRNPWLDTEGGDEH